MLSVCHRYIRDRIEAEETMINGFCKVFEKLEQFKASGPFEAWLRKIMVNESLMYLRKNKPLFLEVQIEDVQIPDNDTHDQHLHADDLMKMIQQLPMGYRTVFNLYAIEGYSHKEIAKILQINENTSKSQLSRARKLLQFYLSKENPLKKIIYYE